MITASAKRSRGVDNEDDIKEVRAQIFALFRFS
jgi:hypothetical protein